MNRRQYLAALGTAAAGTTAAVGTGAFTSVNAGRNVSVQTATDSNALLGLVPGDTGLVSEQDGTLQINLGGSATGASGVNFNAVTTVGDPDNFREEFAFKIVNQGTQPIFLGLSYDFDDPSWLDAGLDQSVLQFEGRGNELERVVGEYDHRRKASFPFQRSNGTTAGGGPAGGSGRIGTTQPIYGQNRSAERSTLDPGTAFFFSILVDTSGTDATPQDALSGTLTIEARVDDFLGVL